MALNRAIKNASTIIGLCLILTSCANLEEPPIENQITITSDGGKAEDTSSASGLENPNSFPIIKASDVSLLAYSYGMEVSGLSDIESKKYYDEFLYKLLSLSREAYPYLASQISESTSPYDILLPYIEAYRNLTGDTLDRTNWFLNPYVNELGKTGYPESIALYQETLRNRLGYSASDLSSLAYGYGIKLSNPEYDSSSINSREDYLEYVDYLITLSVGYYPSLSGLLSVDNNVDSIMSPYELYFDSMNDPSDEKTDWRTNSRLYAYMTDSRRPLPSLYEVQEDFQRDMAEAARAIKCIFGVESC